MKTDERSRLLGAINEVMNLHQLPKLPVERLGDLRKDQAEILGINDFRGAEDGSLVVDYRTMVPNIGERGISVRYGGSGCVVIPLLSVSQNGEPSSPKIALVKKWRVENGDWSYELPRGRVTPDEHKQLEDPDASPVYRIMGETFGAECQESLGRAVLVAVGKIDQRGEASAIDVVLMRAEITRDFLRRPGDGRITLVPLEQLLKLMDDDLGKEPTRVTEAVTAAALLKCARKLNW